jgi:hypothetical protein
MLGRVYEAAERECRISIYFVMSDDGGQENPARDLITTFIQQPSLDTARNLGERLCSVTPGQGGLGLLFFILGLENQRHKLVISRFPADQGVIGEAQRGGLTVQFLERVFMKSATAYKAALYSGESFDEDFRTGYAVDKQRRGADTTISQYWIHRFLKSDFETTSKEGTRRFAVSLRDATKSAPEVSTKHELVSLGKLAHNLNGQLVSIDEIIDRYALSEDAAEEILNHLPHRGLSEDIFEFDAQEFGLHALYASVELDTGGVLMAPPERFDETFEREDIDPNAERVRFTTVGRIVGETVRGRR